MSSYVDILEGGSPYKILSIGIKFFADVVKIKIFSVDLITAISGNIVDNYDEIVGVVLSKYRIEVVLDTEFRIIVIAWNNNTHWNLSCVITQFVNRSYPFVLFSFYSFLFLI
jgi:hypothetical protein